MAIVFIINRLLFVKWKLFFTGVIGRKTYPAPAMFCRMMKLSNHDSGAFKRSGSVSKVLLTG
jgi:hypothetical protein